MIKLLENIQRRIALMVTKTILESVDDSEGIQKIVLTGLKYDRRTNVERYQEFGFTSNPPEGAEVIMLSIGGSRSHNIGIASEDRRYRMADLQPGESCVYNQFGDYVKLREDGTIEVKASTKVLIDAPDVEVMHDCLIHENLVVGGDLTVAGNVVVAGAVTVAGAIGAVGNIISSGGSIQDLEGTTLKEIKDTYNIHTHNDPDTGVTSVPNQPVT